MNEIKMKLLKFILCPFLLYSSLTFSCSFDTDCNVGSHCLKGNGQLYGICAGGMNPGNSYDSQPVYSPTDVNHSYGNTCQFDTDCGINAHCMKSGGSIYGTCM